MKGTLVILAFALLLPAGSSAQPIYGWSLSESDTQTCLNQGVPTFAVKNIYLWHTYRVGADPIAAADFTVGGTIVPLAFSGINGFLNAGDAINVLLAVGGCPDPPIVAGFFLIVDTSGTMFLGGARLTVDCVVNNAYPSPTTGWSSDGSSPVEFLVQGFGGCVPTISVEPASWSRVKGMYR